ncbi:unnamed protein product [Discosporangium mesarthrocarpum]
MDLALIISLSYSVARIPSDVKINKAQCELLVERVATLTNHLERMQVEKLHDQLGKKHQTLHLEIDYHSLAARSIQAEALDLADMEKQLQEIAKNMEASTLHQAKLEQSVSRLSGEGQSRHDEVMSALKELRIYRRTFNQDQMKDGVASCSPSNPAPSEFSSKPPPHGYDGRTQPGSLPTGQYPALGQGPGGARGSRRVWGAVEGAGVVSIQSLPGYHGRGGHHNRPYSQSALGVGGAGEGFTGRLVAFPISGKEGTEVGVGGEGGARRGEYEVSFGEGQMGLSIRNIDGRAEISKVEVGGAAQAAGVKRSDMVIGVNGRVPLGYSQAMRHLTTSARPVRVRLVRATGGITSEDGRAKPYAMHANTWTSNAVTAGVHHPEGDRGVLLEMYAKTSLSGEDPPWVRSQGWDEKEYPLEDPYKANSAECNNQGGGDGLGGDWAHGWSGVRVGRGGRVVDIKLPGNGMDGVLPASMGSLEELRTLELRENRLKGNIPETLRYLERLHTLDLSHNLLEGSVPYGDSRWINRMTVLLLNSNRLSGHIPGTLGRLANLQHLNLSFNRLGGGIPQELSGLKNIKVLCLAHNSLAGPLPESLGELRKLKTFNLGHNKIAGPLPKALGRLVALEKINLRHNLITGGLPEDMLTASTLKTVDLSNNQLEGELPPTLGAGLSEILELDLSRNSLSGEIPSTVGTMPKLKRLDLSANRLCGSLPTSLADLRSLEHLSLSRNQLSGPLIHVGWGKLQCLQHLHLNNNQLTDALPPSLGSLTGLVGLTLNSNQLTGNVPREMFELEGTIKLLDLSGNKISTRRNSFFSEARRLKKKLSGCDVRL